MHLVEAAAGTEIIDLGETGWLYCRRLSALTLTTQVAMCCCFVVALLRKEDTLRFIVRSSRLLRSQKGFYPERLYEHCMKYYTYLRCNPQLIVSSLRFPPRVVKKNWNSANSNFIARLTSVIVCSQKNSLFISLHISVAA